MDPRIETLTEKKFAGNKITMSFSNNQTVALWQRFMPRRKDIQNSIGIELYSIEVYPPDFFNPWDPDATFEKWATVEVTDFDTIPPDMDTLAVSDGLYAVFIHKGPASTGPATYQYIFETWLPASDYALDSRPHFAVMGEKYKHEAPDSEEELWIPITPA